MCAVFPPPASRITGLPAPPQSSTSSRKFGVTATNRTEWGDGSCQESGGWERSGTNSEASKRGHANQIRPGTEYSALLSVNTLPNAQCCSFLCGRIYVGADHPDS